MNQKGFSQIILLGIIAVLILAGAGGVLVFREKDMPSPEKMVQQGVSSQKTEGEAQPPETHTIEYVTKPTLSPTSPLQPAKLKTQPALQPTAPPSSLTKVIIEESERGYWQGWPDHYRPVGNIPPCPEPVVIPLPVDHTKITSILYPGQYRGGQYYKAHGGFRLDNLPDTKIIVRIPLDAELIYGSRHTIQGSEVQYLLGFRMPCGIEYRLDHLRVLEPKFQKLIDAILPLKVDDSRTTNFNPPIPVKAGEIIAVEVGTLNPRNVGFDFGVYDLRKKNKKAADPEWVKARGNDVLSQYAVCWFDWLSPEDEKIIRSLPAADGVSGSKSDFCE